MSISESFSFSVAEAVDALGGERAVNPLGRAVVELRNEEIRCTAVESAILFGGDCTASPLGRALLAVRDEEAGRASNLTAGWIKTHGVRVRAMLVSFLTAKLTTSRRMELIEDHVQTFLLRMVERDTFRPILIEGKEPSPSVLRIWLMQSAATEMRGWGVDASLRVSRGAKTNRDRLVDAGKAVPAPVIHANPVREVVSVADSGDVSSDYFDGKASPEDAMADRQMIEIYRRRICEKLNERHAAVFDLLLEGAKRREVAEEQGLTTAQVAVMISQIREVVAD